MDSTQTLVRLALPALIFLTAAPLHAQDRIPWVTIDQARQLSQRQNRLVLLHFWRESCEPCRTLERRVFNRPEFIRALTTGYIPVKINADTNPLLVEHYGIRSVPTDVIVTPEGREIQRFTSKQDPDQYIAVLDGIRARAGVGVYAQASAAGGQARQSSQPSGHDGAAESQLPPRGASGAFNQGQYTNPLQQNAAPQRSNVAPRYANPYGAEQGSSNTSTQGSRWGSAEPAQPETNRFAHGNTSAQNASRYSDSGVQSSNDGAIGSQYQLNRQAPQSNPQPKENQFFQDSMATNVPGSDTNPSIGIPDNRLSQDRGAIYGTQPQQSSVPSQMPQQPPTAAGLPIALEGFCPVSLVLDRAWKDGNRQWGARHNGHLYFFAGPQQQQEFLRNASVYAPLMSGYDPVIYLETGQRVPGKREFGVYVLEPGPIALFANEATLQRFEGNPEYYTQALQRQAQARPPQFQRR